MKTRKQIFCLLLAVTLFFGLFPASASAKGASKNDSEPAPVRAAMPVLIGAEASENGITVTWNPVPDVNYYRIYRRSAKTGWRNMGYVSEESYTDTGTLRGRTYIYSVRCMADDERTVISDFDREGVSAKALIQYGAPKLLGAEASNRGITVTWEAVSGVENYRLYRKSGDSGWKKVEDVSDTSYTDAQTLRDTVYTYTVRCLSGDGQTVTSLYDSKGVSATAFIQFPTPKLLGAEASESGITVTWEAVPDVENYRVYRRSGEEKWKALASVSDTAYTDTSVETGTAYTYTVRCLSLDGERLVSSYDSTGVSATGQ